MSSSKSFPCGDDDLHGSHSLPYSCYHCCLLVALRTSNRTQRATARSLAGSSAQSMILADVSLYQSGLEADLIPVRDDEQLAASSRSASLYPMEGTSSQHSERHVKRGSRKGNGKGKEKAEEGNLIHVKEEPVSMQLSDLPAVQVSP